MDALPSPAAIASMILSAPAWVRIGLSHKPIQRYAAEALAERIVAEASAGGGPDPRQLALGL